MTDADDELRGELRDQLVAALQRVPEIAGRELTLTALSGGITNRNYLITVAGVPERYVIRLAGNDTHLLGISREVEHAATVAAAGRWRGAGGGGLHPAGGLPRHPLHRRRAGQPRAGARAGDPARVADSIRRIHGGPAIPGLFVPLRIVEAYLALAAAARRPASRSRTTRRVAVGRRIERALLGAPIELRPCHNDLLNANFIDDGERIRIVDWEYAGMGDPVLRPGQLQHQPRADAGRRTRSCWRPTTGEVRPTRLARLALMRVVSDFREAMWGVLQQGISTPRRRLRGVRGRALRAAAAPTPPSPPSRSTCARRRMADRAALPDRARA